MNLQNNTKGNRKGTDLTLLICILGFLKFTVHEIYRVDFENDLDL